MPAVGNSLHHYHRIESSSELTDDIQPLEGDNGEATSNRQIFADILPEHIHGLLCIQYNSAAGDGRHNYRIVAYGGRHIVQLSLSSSRDAKNSNNARFVRISPPVRFDDRISSGYLCADTVGADLVLLTYHGLAVQLMLNWPSISELDGWDSKIAKTAQVVRTVKCAENETLYCSKVLSNGITLSARNLLESLSFLGGTAFGELIVWQMNANTKEALVLNRISCHNVSHPFDITKKNTLSKTYQISGRNFLHRLRSNTTFVNYHIR